jgi:chromosome segregation ATPase
MAADFGDATTSIDSLVELIKSKGKMELGKIASTLGVDPSIVENWAKICEGGNILRISYELGKMYVEPITISKEQEQIVKAQVGVEGSIVEQEIVSQRLSLDKLSETLQALDTSVKSAEKMFQQKMPDIEQKLNVINKVYRALEDDAERVEKLKKQAEESSSAFNKRIAELYSKIDAINTGEIPRKMGQNIEATEAALKKSNEIQLAMQQAARTKKEALDGVRRSVEEQLKSVRYEVDKLEHDIEVQFKIYGEQVAKNIKEINEEAKQLNEVKSNLSGFLKERDRARKAIDDIKMQFNDQFTKTYSKMNQSDSALKTGIDAMKTELDELKDNFGDASKIFDTIQSVKSDVQTLNSQINAHKTEVSRLLEEIRALDAATKGSIESKYITLQRLKLRSKEIKDNVSNMKKKTENASQKFDDIVK